jgi:hypothetical protein
VVSDDDAPSKNTSENVLLYEWDGVPAFTEASVQPFISEEAVWLNDDFVDAAFR